MKQIVEWLINIENKASEIYETLATKIPDDKNFVKLLDHLAEDEAMHYHFMISALRCIEKYPQIQSEIILDDDTKKEVEADLEILEEMIVTNGIDRELIVKCIIKSEISEWNDIFLYVVNNMKTRCSRFKYIGPSIQHHLRYIDKYFEKFPEFMEVKTSI